ncbi:uncharacterized protein BT62DRAFT_1074944 [Guyanagaster necrorhizus]|uniref:F-box domain-containing protein n=1 Tax=Guyanagaster necrorhizus TaxID=856835 RepID=A0A9P8ATL4_9AGAR|nr:uncharacterized protein BT62DRAFT_1074944 [Guyanagaster necrorhizus MCA 3950]KAG7447558.1 hypothetical protein BT62DRAFT_1074944 [Guyanagaster necrorhizus MCA 3950]
MTSKEIPYDVWQCISAFVPESQLAELFAVNRAFHRAAMNVRYRRVEFNAFNDHKMWLLERLRDPVVAKRVHTLHVETWSVFTSHYLRGLTIYCSDEIIRAMIGAVQGMTNLRELHIHWRNHLFSQDLVPFFTTVWELKADIHRLVLVAPLGRFRTLLSTATRKFRHLRQLEIVVQKDSFSSAADDMNAANVQQDIFTPFINNAQETLQSLFIKTVSGVDFTPVIASLGYFPCLRKLALVIPPPGESLVQMLNAHAETLTHFEWAMSSLDPDVMDSEDVDDAVESLTSNVDFVDMDTLGLYITQRCYPIALKCISKNAQSLTRLHIDGLLMRDGQLDKLTGLLGSSCLKTLSITVETLSLDAIEILSRLPPSLKSLCLGFRNIKLPQEPSTLPPSTLSIHQLTELDIRGAYLSLSHLSVVLSAFAHYFLLSGLESLNVDVQSLNPQLIDLLATCLPSMYSLWLRIIELTGENDEDDRWLTKLGAFTTDMKGRWYPKWRLEDVRITSTYFDASRPGEAVRLTEHTEIVEVLALSIPAMR